MYDVDSGLIAALLLILMAAAIEVGFRIGRRNAGATKEAKEHIYAIQNATLGILSLLLGFTFSLSLQHFDGRSEAVVEEANSISTAYVRALLVASPLREEIRAELRNYVDLRVAASVVSLDRRAERKALLQSTVAAQDVLSEQALRVADQARSNAVTTLVVQSLNGISDTYARREALNDRHVPEVVSLLLYGAFLMAGGMIGFASGTADHRPSRITYATWLALVVVLVFLIADLDRPRRGLIQVSVQNLLELQTMVHRTAGPR